MREKESFITQVAVEARNPLNHALDHIKGTPHILLIQAHIDAFVGPFLPGLSRVVSHLVLFTSFDNIFFSTPLYYAFDHLLYLTCM